MEEILIRFVINIVASILMHCVIKHILKNKNIANTMLDDDELKEYYLMYANYSIITDILLPIIYNILIMGMIYVVYVYYICFVTNVLYLTKTFRVWLTLQLFVTLTSIIPCLAGYLKYKYEVESQR